MSRPPLITVTEDGLYLRLKRSVRPWTSRTRPGWPAVTVDFSRKGEVIGIEVVPLPRRLDLDGLVRKAGARLPRRGWKIELQFAHPGHF